MTPRTSSPARAGGVGEPAGVRRAAMPQRGSPTFTSMSTSRMPLAAAAASVASLSTATVTRAGARGHGPQAARVERLVGEQQVVAEAGRGHAHDLAGRGAGEGRWPCRACARARAVHLWALTWGRSGGAGAGGRHGGEVVLEGVDIDHERRRGQVVTFTSVFYPPPTVGTRPARRTPARTAPSAVRGLLGAAQPVNEGRRSALRSHPVRGGRSGTWERPGERLRTVGRMSMVTFTEIMRIAELRDELVTLGQLRKHGLSHDTIRRLGQVPAAHARLPRCVQRGPWSVG